MREVYVRGHAVIEDGSWYTVELESGVKVLAHASEIVIPREKDAEFRVSNGHPATSKAVAPKIRSGTLQADMLELFEGWKSMGIGWTDDELEQQLGRSHQSVSATRNTLMRKGLIDASGITRKTRSGNEAIVWVRSPVKVQP